MENRTNKEMQSTEKQGDKEEMTKKNVTLL